MNAHLLLHRHGGPAIPEAVLWSYTTQLCSLLAKLHSANTACRALRADYVLLTAENRIRVNNFGLAALLAQNNDQRHIADYQVTKQTVPSHCFLFLFVCCCFSSPFTGWRSVPPRYAPSGTCQSNTSCYQVNEQITKQKKQKKQHTF